MRRVARLLPALAALFFLGACATAETNAATDTRGWFLGSDGGESRLAYGTPQSDDAPLLLSCAPRSGWVKLSQGRLQPGDGVTLAADGRRAVFHGDVQPDQLNGGVMVTAQARADAPVLRRFRDTGRVEIVEEGRSSLLTATPEERQAIRSFFDRCAAA